MIPQPILVNGNKTQVMVNDLSNRLLAVLEEFISAHTDLDNVDTEVITLALNAVGNVAAHLIAPFGKPESVAEWFTENFRREIAERIDIKLNRPPVA